MQKALHNDRYGSIKILCLKIVFVTCVLCIILLSCIFLMNSIPHIDIEDYETSVDYGILSSKQIETFNSILLAADNNKAMVGCPAYSLKEQHEISTQLGLYFGTTENIEHLVYWRDNSANLNLSMFKKLFDQKIIIDARVDEAVSTLIDGSDEYKLWQISNYISKKITYTDGCRDIITALNGKGVCNSYSMLFYKMATRIGIKTYICYGYADDGYHSWNMVELNGEYLYYDVTWYDNIVHNVRYVRGKSSWDRIFQVNNKWSTDLNH